MTKYKIVAVLAALVLLAFVVVSLAPQGNVFYNKKFDGLSGKAITENTHCAVICESKFKPDYSRLILYQPSNPAIVASYTIREDDYFSIAAISTTNEIRAVYRYDGLLFNDPKSIMSTSPFENTDNYLKLSLVYAGIREIGSTQKNNVLYKFNCNGKQVLVPIPGRTKAPFNYNGRFGVALDSYNNKFRFAEVKIYPFEDSSIGNDPSYFGFHLKPYARAQILTIGADPATGIADNVKDSRLLVDLDGNGELGGDGNGWTYSTVGICDNNKDSDSLEKSSNLG